jgi:hypothetical protein
VEGLEEVRRIEPDARIAHLDPGPIRSTTMRAIPRRCDWSIGTRRC